MVQVVYVPWDEHELQDEKTEPQCPEEDVSSCPAFTGIESQASHWLQAVSSFESARAADLSWLIGVSHTISIMLIMFADNGSFSCLSSLCSLFFSSCFSLSLQWLAYPSAPKDSFPLIVTAV